MRRPGQAAGRLDVPLASGYAHRTPGWRLFRRTHRAAGHRRRSRRLHQRLWYASAVFGDPLVPMAIAGKATNTIELGTSVLQTYTCHPVLQANRAAATAAAMERPGFTLGVGPSHQVVIEDMFGLSYDSAGSHTEEYVNVLAPLLRGE